jgi:hypothetical protein
MRGSPLARLLTPYGTTWLIVRLPMFLVLAAAGWGLFRCVSTTATDTAFAEYLSPDRARKVLVSAPDHGALGWGTPSVAIVDADATSPTGGCVLLFTDHAFLHSGKAIAARWLDDAHVELTYPEGMTVSHVSTRCSGVDVAHVLTKR